MLRLIIIISTHSYWNKFLHMILAFLSWALIYFCVFVCAGVVDGMEEQASGVHLNEPRVISFTRSVHHDTGVKGDCTGSGQHQNLSAQPGGSRWLRETEGHARRGFTAQGAYAVKMFSFQTIRGLGLTETLASITIIIPTFTISTVNILLQYYSTWIYFKLY